MCDGLALLEQHPLGRSGGPAGVDDQKIVVGQRIDIGFAVRLRGEPGLEWRRGEVAGIEADDRFEIGAIADFAEFLGEFGLDNQDACAAVLQNLMDFAVGEPEADRHMDESALGCGRGAFDRFRVVVAEVGDPIASLHPA